MKIYAVFITAVLPVVSAAAAAAGEDGAAAATTTVDRPHLRALLQGDRLGCASPVDDETCDSYTLICSGCEQGATQCTQKGTYIACCNSGGNNCYDPGNVLTGAAQEDYMFVKADEEEEEEEEEVPQDTVKLDKIEIPSSSTLRAASLLKDNVLLQETPIEPARVCPKIIDGNYGDQSTASISCADTPGYCDGCDSQYSSCVQKDLGLYNGKGCCTNSNNMNNCFGQNEEEDSMFINADEADASLLKVE